MDFRLLRKKGQWQMRGFRLPTPGENSSAVLRKGYVFQGWPWGLDWAISPQHAKPDRPAAKQRVARGRKGPKRAGANKGVWGEAPAGFGTAAPGLQGEIFNRSRGHADAHFTLRLDSGGQKKLPVPEVHTKKLPPRKRATKTPRWPANSTGKWRRQNKGGALGPAFESRTTPCAPLRLIRPGPLVAKQLRLDFSIGAWVVWPVRPPSRSSPRKQCPRTEWWFYRNPSLVGYQ
jgi:hypothetical protein